MDVRTLSGIADDSVELIEHHHLLEHLDREEARIAVENWARVLVPRGYMVMTVPDLDLVVRRWRGADHAARYSEAGTSVIEMFYGSQQHAGMFHKWGYDRAALTDLLVGGGFQPLLSIAPFPAGRTTPSRLAVARTAPTSGAT